jgi:hypothetical protein
MGRPKGVKNQTTASRTTEELEKIKNDYIEQYKQKLKQQHKEQKEKNQQTIQSLKDKLPFEMVPYASSIKIILKDESDIQQLLSMLK